MATAAICAAGVETFSWEEGRFTILFADKPRVSQQVVRLPFGNMTVHLFTAPFPHQTGEMLVSYSDYPPQALAAKNADEMLEKFAFPTPSRDLIGAYRAWLRSASPRRRCNERFWFPIRRLSGNARDPLPALGELSELERLIAQYLYRGRWQARLLRVGLATTAATCVVLLLEYILMVFEFNLGVSLVNGFAQRPGLQEICGFELRGRGLLSGLKRTILPHPNRTDLFG